MSAAVESIALRVRDVDRVRRFYSELVGLEVVGDGEGRIRLGIDSEIVTLTESEDAPDRAGGEAGLFHLAIRYPDRGALADALERLRDANYPLAGASDHAVSEALYTADPAGNDVELYRDRPESEWEHDSAGRVRMTTRRLDPADLGRDATADPPGRAPAGTDLGHVHLEVTDVERAVEFYRDRLGMEVRATRRGAAFMAWDGYHHHVAVNTWRGRREPRGAESVGVERVTASVPDEVFERVRRRAEGREADGDGYDDSIDLEDPDEIRWNITSDGTPDD